MKKQECPNYWFQEAYEKANIIDRYIDDVINEHYENKKKENAKSEK